MALLRDPISGRWVGGTYGGTFVDGMPVLILDVDITERQFLIVLPGGAFTIANMNDVESNWSHDGQRWQNSGYGVPEPVRA